MSIAFNGATENKSDIIRMVYKAQPLATNKQIKNYIKERYKIDVGANLIIAAIGRYKSRKILAPAREGLLKQSREFLKKFLDDADQCCWFIREAAATL